MKGNTTAVLSAAVVAALAMTGAAHAAAISLAGNSGTYTQDFDTLPNTVLVGQQYNNFASDSTIEGWYASRATGGPNDRIYISAGTLNTGALYSFGVTGNTERALGSIGSGGPDTIAWGAQFVNNTGRLINSITIAYTGEQWRDGGTSTTGSVAQTMSFFYRVGGTTFENPVDTSSTSTATTPTGWTAFNGLDFTSPTFGATSGTALDGNNALNQATFNLSLGSISIPAGATFWVRWDDPDHPSADHGLSVDNFSLTWDSIPTPVRNLTWNGTPGDNTWNNAAANWLDGVNPASWDDSAPDNAIFGPAAAEKNVLVSGTRTTGSIAINAAGYAISGGTLSINGEAGSAINAASDATISSSISLNNNLAVTVGDGATLSVSGTIIGGELTKSGNGTLNLTGNVGGNTHAKTLISQGTVSISDESQLGGFVELNGGTLRTTANIAQTINVLSNSTIDTPVDVEFNNPGGAFISAGFSQGLTKIGAGTLLLSTPAPSYLGNNELVEGTIRLTASEPLFNNRAGLGNGRVFIRNGATLHIDGIDVGLSTDSLNQAMTVFGDNGGRLLVSGISSLAGSQTFRVLRDFEGDPQRFFTLETADAATVFSIKNSVRQWNVSPPFSVGVANATIVVTGLGKVILESGGTSSNGSFGGSWDVQNGILQVGPGPVDAFGEPLNALGFYSRTGSTQVENQWNAAAVTVSGGTLAVAVNAVNQFPLTDPASELSLDLNDGFADFVPYIRNPITLSGGAIANTGLADAEGAKFGGSLTIQGVTSRVLAYDPNSPATPRNVSIIKYGDMNWEGDLTVATNGTAGGVVTIFREPTQIKKWNSEFSIYEVGTQTPTVNVADGARLIIESGATVVVNASAVDPFTDTENESVAIAGTGAFSLVAGSAQVAKLNAGAVTVDTATLKIQERGVGTGLNKVASLALTSGGVLNITDNAVVVESGATAASVDALLDSAQLISSSESASMGIGYAPGTVATSLFNGYTPADSEFVVVLTLRGDFNVDGTVNVGDLGVLASNWDGSGKYWFEGDSNNDGFVNVGDLGNLASTWNATVTGLSFSEALALFPELRDVEVPEPASLGLLAIGAMALLRRRK